MRATLILALGMASLCTFAQLNPGDIVFTGYNSDPGSDGFAFAFTTSVTAGEVIIFTDNGYQSSGSFRTTEGLLSYTVPAGGKSAYDFVAVEDRGSGYVASDGATLTEYGSLNPAVGGDQFTAFQGTVTSASNFTVSNVIAMLDYYNVGGSSNAFDADATSSQTTAIHPSLTNGTTAIAVGTSNASDDNGRLVFSSSTLALSRSDFLSFVCNPSNWENDGAIIYTLPGNPINTWNGSAWSEGSAPDASELAEFEDDFTVSSDISVGELIVTSGQTLTLDSGFTMTVNGDVTIDGDIAGKGKLQIVSGTFPARIRRATNISGILEVPSSSEVEASGNLTITFTDGNTFGTIIGDGTINGDVDVQTYLDLSGGASDGRYYHLGNPVQSAYNDWNDDGNTMIAANDNTGTTWLWNASNAEWEAPSALSDNVPLATGVAVYSGSTSGVDFLQAEAGSIVLTGSVRLDDVVIALGYNNGQASSVQFTNAVDPENPSVAESEGWNFLANPYLAAYTWTGQTLPSGMANATYIWNGSNYQSYVNGVGVNGGIAQIAPHQGFFVQTTNSTPGNFTFAAAQRIEAEESELFKSEADGVRFNLTRANGNNDETYVGFTAEASSEYDLKFDARKLTNGPETPNISVVHPTGNYSIYHTNDGDVPQLSIRCTGTVEGELLTLCWDVEHLKSFNGEFTVFDTKEQRTLKPDECPYEFNYDSNVIDRFIVSFKTQNSEVSTGLQDGFMYFNGSEYIFLGSEDELNGSLVISDLTGRTLHESTLTSNAFNLPDLPNVAVATYTRNGVQYVQKLISY